MKATYRVLMAGMLTSMLSVPAAQAQPLSQAEQARLLLQLVQLNNGIYQRVHASPAQSRNISPLRASVREKLIEAIKLSD